MTVTGEVTIQQNIEHIDNYYDYRGIEKKSDIPAVLQREDAQELLIKAQKAGLLDDSFQPVTPKSVAALLAFEIARRLKLEPQWTPFELMWKCTNLRIDYSRAIETHKSSETIRKIEDILDS